MSNNSAAPSATAATENDDQSNVGIAFAVTMGAGAATALGAAIVFVPSLVRYAQRKTLAGALGLAAGVMIYVSFIEIFQKSRNSFADSGLDDNTAYIYATLSLFGGVIFMMMLNFCVSYLLRGDHHHDHCHEPLDHLSSKSKQLTYTTNSSKKEDDNDDDGERELAGAEVAAKAVAASACCSHNPIEDLENFQQMARACEQKEEPENDDNYEEESGQVSLKCKTNENECDIETPSSDNSANNDHEDVNKEDIHHPQDGKLMRMSINTAIAIGLHNFPEGLATFVATLNDPRVGGVLGLAIAIHNIPEGLCVAMPIYFATGKRWKAFAWGIISGISEPIAAVLGYAVLANSFSDVIFAVLFGLVSGMMVVISTRELLPTAHRYDPEDSVVTYSFISGMGIMALSLVLFLL